MQPSCSRCGLGQLLAMVGRIAWNWIAPRGAALQGEKCGWIVWKTYAYRSCTLCIAYFRAQIKNSVIILSELNATKTAFKCVLEAIQEKSRAGARKPRKAFLPCGAVISDSFLPRRIEP